MNFRVLNLYTLYLQDSNTNWKYLHNHGIEYTSSDPKDLLIQIQKTAYVYVHAWDKSKLDTSYTTYFVSIWGIEKTEIRPIYGPFARLKMLTNA